MAGNPHFPHLFRWRCFVWTSFPSTAHGTGSKILIFAKTADLLRFQLTSKELTAFKDEQAPGSKTVFSGKLDIRKGENPRFPKSTAIFGESIIENRKPVLKKDLYVKIPHVRVTRVRIIPGGRPHDTNPFEIDSAGSPHKISPD